MKPLKHIKHTHVRQHGEYSFGLACLASIVKYHEGEIRQEQLRHTGVRLDFFSPNP